MQNKNLAVSGDSKILRWLVDTSLEMTPWLTATSKGLKIDTEKAVKEWERSTGKATTAEMLLAKKLLKELNFEELLDEHPKGKAESFLVTPMPLPEKVKKILQELKKNIVELSQSLNQIAPKNEFSSESLELKGIQQLCEKSCEVVDKIHHIQMMGHFNISMERRHKVAKGDILEFLYASDKARYPSEDAWPLAKRLVKAQADLYFKLESIIKEKKELEGKSFQDLDISSSLKTLAALEQRLGRTMVQVDDEPSKTSYLYEINRTFVALDKSMKIIGEIETNEDFRLFQEGKNSSPLNKLGCYLTAILGDIISSLYFHLSRENIRNYIMKLRYLMSDLSDIDDELDDDIPNVNFEVIEDFFDWLIREAPFMTLIYSGFLNIIKINKRFYVSLSPWLVTSVTAKKLFGHLPLTHVENKVSYAIETSEEDKGETDPTLSGRRAWARIQEHGDYQH